MKVVILGAGEVGIHLATRLVQEGQDVVIIDQDQERVDFARNHLDIQALQGEGSSPRVLRDAGIATADMIIAVTTSDEVNMIACLIASTQSSTSMKIARIRNMEYLADSPILGKGVLGIDLHINPEMEAAETILKMIEIPKATEVVDLADGKVRLVGIKINEQCPVIGQQLKYLPEFHADKKVLIAALERDGKVIIPGGNDSMEAGDNIWVISVPENVDHVLAGLGISCEPIKRAMIFGGTIITRMVADKLLKMGLSLKIVDSDYHRCMRMAEEFPKAVVLHSPHVDQDLFEEENISATDAFISSSLDDEENVLSALLAKRMGTRKVVTVLERPTYTQIVSTIGVDNVVSKRLAAVNKILAYLRKGRVRSAIALGNESTEIIEFEALETSQIVGKPLQEVTFPRGLLVVAIIHEGEVRIPGGKDVIQPGDHVLILTVSGNIKAIERLVSVSLSYF